MSSFKKIIFLFLGALILIAPEPASAAFVYNPSAPPPAPVLAPEPAPAPPAPLVKTPPLAKAENHTAVNKALQDVKQQEKVAPKLVSPVVKTPPVKSSPQPVYAKPAYDSPTVTSGLTLVKGSLREQLTKHAKGHGYQVAWNHPNDLYVTNSTTFSSGYFLGDIKQLFETLQAIGRRDMNVVVFQGNKTIVVEQSRR